MILTPTLVLLAALVGLGGGVLAGMLGLGGGLLINPVLIALLGVPAPVAVGTGVCQIIGASTSGVLRRRGSGTVDWPMALTLAGGSTMGVAVGVAILNWLKARSPWIVDGRAVSVADVVVLGLFVAIMLVEAGWMIRDLWREARMRLPATVEPLAPGRAGRKPPWFATVALPPFGRSLRLPYPRFSIPAVAWLGVLAGISTGLLGVGGGLILLPALVYLVGERTAVAAGTSLAVTWFASLVGGAIHAWHGNVHLGLLAALLAGSTIGAQFGSAMGMRMSGPQLRACFVAVCLAIAALGVWRLVGVFQWI